MKTYTNKIEATRAFQQFTKAMNTVRERYTKPGQADAIIERMMNDKFGADADFSLLISEFATGKYDIIVGRMRQAEKVRNNRNKAEAEAHLELIETMTAYYIGIGEITAAA